MKKLKMTNKIRKTQISPQRIIYRARYGGLSRLPRRLTAGRLAKIKCAEGYSALHYAARFGHLDEIHGGVTVAQLANARSDIDWIIEYDAGTGQSKDQIFSGATALSIATTYGHLDQVKDSVTLSKLDACKDADGRSALQALLEVIRVGKDPVVLGNNIFACSEILELLSPSSPTHVAAVRHAMSRNRNLEALLKPEMTAALL